MMQFYLRILSEKDLTAEKNSVATGSEFPVLGRFQASSGYCNPGSGPGTLREKDW